MTRRIALAALLSGTMVSGPSRATAQSAGDVPQDPSAVGYLNLHTRHPDAAGGGEEFDRLYSADQALGRLQQMRGFLESFRRLTEQVRGRVDRTQLQAVGNTGTDVQTIGFHNIPLIVEGTVLKQQYQLAQARYELALLKDDRQQISAEELARFRSAYRDATARLQTFWDTKLPAD